MGMKGELVERIDEEAEEVRSRGGKVHRPCQKSTLAGSKSAATLTSQKSSRAGSKRRREEEEQMLFDKIRMHYQLHNQEREKKSMRGPTHF